MALPTVTVVYSVPVKGQTATNLAAALAAVPLPLRTLFDLGVYVVTDVTAAGPPATRTITLRINSANPPTATPNRVPGVDASGIESVNVTHIGSGLIRPPVFLPVRIRHRRPSRSGSPPLLPSTPLREGERGSSRT